MEHDFHEDESRHTAVLLAAALGLGALAMYLGDPQSGRRRRALIKDQYTHAARKVRHGADKALRDASNRAHGLVAEARRALVEQRPRPHRPGARMELMQENWSPAWRSLAGALGAGLTTAGWIRGGMKGLILGAIGSGLAARAATNKSMASLIGAAAACRGVVVQKSLYVDAPVEEVYAHWTIENFPNWMSHVKEVTPLGSERHHWVVEGPAGFPVEWNSEITRAVPNEALEWRSEAGSMVDNAGRVHFQPEGSGTRVNVALCYMPPAGAIGHVVAKALGSDPKSRMDDDLMRFKSLIETGRPAHDAAARRGSPGAWPSSEARH